MRKASESVLADVCFSARRALRGQTPASLRAYSFAVDETSKLILLRAHFAVAPSAADLADISVVDTEICADFLDRFETKTDVEVAPPATSLSLLDGGIAYLRAGEPGECCSVTDRS